MHGSRWMGAWWLDLCLLCLFLSYSQSSLQHKPTFGSWSVLKQQEQQQQQQTSFPATYGYLFRLFTISTPLKWIDEALEETRLRLLTFNKYKAKTQAHIDTYFEEFKAKQYDVLQEAQVVVQSVHHVLFESLLHGRHSSRSVGCVSAELCNHWVVIH